ncbi:hypothetical protein NST70_13590 [Weizmannia sp. FSL K6-0777]|uniref:hypothetical protein n=1 Tax=Weizmannia sp. FSL K6-0777 TaxID=2954674 RepID=UPI0031587AB8
MGGSYKFPDLIELSDFNGDWVKYEDHLYSIFVSHFVYSKPLFKGKIVNYRRTPEVAGKIQSFFHVTSVNSSLTKNPDDRIPDLRRCERIHWIRKIIDDYSNKVGIFSEIKCWAEDWKQYKRWHLLLEHYKFLVVIEERETYNLLVTSFYLEKDHQVKKKLKKFNDYVQMQRTPF